MAVSRDTTTTHVCSDDATFRAWAQSIHDRLSAVGLVQTSDTGQIDLSTVSRPGTATAAGYEIWRFADSDQASAPVFLKIEYGIGSAATRPRLWVTTGTGSDGSGAISGAMTLGSADASLSITPASTPSGAGTVHAALSGGALVVNLHGSNASATSQNHNYGFAVERLRHPETKAIRGSGAICFVCHGSGITLRHWSMENDVRPFAPFTTGGIVGSNDSTALDGSDAMLNTMVPFTLRAHAPLISIMGYRGADIADDSVDNVTTGGVARSYRSKQVSYTVCGMSGTSLLLLNG